MLPYKSPLLTVVPQTLEKRREVTEAFRALATQQNEALRCRGEDLRAIRRDLEAFRRDCGLLELEIRKVCRDFASQLGAESKKYSPDQPRVPAGNPDGGQWTSENGAASAAPNGSNLSVSMAP